MDKIVRLLVNWAEVADPKIDDLLPNNSDLNLKVTTTYPSGVVIAKDSTGKVFKGRRPSGQKEFYVEGL